MSDAEAHQSLLLPEPVPAWVEQQWRNLPGTGVTWRYFRGIRNGWKPPPRKRVFWVSEHFRSPRMWRTPRRLRRQRQY